MTRSKEHKHTHILWDWNGTLFDDVHASMGVINKILADRGLAILGNVHDYQRAFGFPIRDYYARLGFDFSKESFEDLAQIYMADYDQSSYACRMFPFAHEVLDSFSKRNITQTILSASERTRLAIQIDRCEAAGYFEDVLALDDFYAQTKLDIAKQWFRDKAVSAKDVLLIGDTVHDHEVASDLGVDCVLVSTGHQATAALGTTSRPIVSTISEISYYL